MRELQVFTNVEFGEVRVLEIKNEPWFVGKDVVKDLGYEVNKTTSYTKYINQYCNEEDIKKVNNSTAELFGIKDAGRKGELLINEYALYDLTFESPLPSAKKFKYWVTHEVLPQIRRTGGYIDEEATTQQLEQLQQKINKLLNYKIKGDTINDVCSATGLRRKDIKRYLFDNDWVVEYNGEIANYDYRYIFIVRHKDIHFTSHGLDKILRDLQPLKPVRPLINKELYRK